MNTGGLSRQCFFIGLHIILNMVTLLYRRTVEAIYGHWRYLGYLLSGIAGNIASFAFGTPNSVSAGASTALLVCSAHLLF